MKLVIVPVLLMVLLFCVPVSGAQTIPLDISYEQVFHNDSDREDVDDIFWYQITARDGAPLPAGNDGERYLWSVEGNREDVLNLEFPFEEAGKYEYDISAYVEEPAEGYIYEPRVFWMTLQVSNEDDALKLLAVTIVSAEDEGKVAVLLLDPEYHEDGEPVTPTGAPSQTTTVTPTPEETPEGTPTDTPTPTEAPEETPTPTGTPEEIPTPTEVPEETPMPTEVPDETPSVTPTPTEVPDETPSVTPTPTDAPEETPAATPTVTPTVLPAVTLTDTLSTPQGGTAQPVASSLSTSPQTGDDTPIAGWMLLLMLTFGSMILLLGMQVDKKK